MYQVTLRCWLYPSRSWRRRPAKYLCLVKSRSRVPSMPEAKPQTHDRNDPGPGTESTPEVNKEIDKEENNGWPSPELLVQLYNEMTPDECPAVDKLTDARRKKAREYLRQFSDQSFWETVLQQISNSEFLRGLKIGIGHRGFVADLDWLLSKGRADQVENCVKVFEGRCADG